MKVRLTLASLITIFATVGCASSRTTQHSSRAAVATATAAATVPPRPSDTGPTRRVYHLVVDASGDAYQKQDLTQVAADSGPPLQLYPATEVGPTCRQCLIADFSPAAKFNVGGTHITQAVRLKMWTGDELRGEWVGRLAYYSPTPLFAIGHVNKFVGTVTIVGGTGSLAGARGTLTRNDATTVVGVDPSTGTAHKHSVSVYRGLLLLPAR
jgi:hypothetical protein